SATDECDTSGHPHPDRMLSTKALEITPDPGGHLILKAVHFLVEIGSSGHARSKGMHSICSNGERSKKGAAHSSQQPRQLGDIRRNPSRLLVAEQLGERAAPSSPWTAASLLFVVSAFEFGCALAHTLQNNPRCSHDG